MLRLGRSVALERAAQRRSSVPSLPNGIAIDAVLVEPSHVPNQDARELDRHAGQ
jgi:hypothetical protein